jgi:UDP-2,3-diacylglucosamine hydrolase
VLVVADVHLGQVPPATAAMFQGFLDTVPRPGDHLLINGDLFDFWFEYGAVVPRKHVGTVAALHALTVRGVRVTLIGGNHDRWGGAFLRDNGIAFPADPVELALAGRRTFVAHGDGLTEQHWSGALTHAILKHRITVRLFRMLHPDIGFWIADKLSGPLADSTKDRAVLDRAAAAQRRFAADLLARRPELGLVVLAHTHRAQLDVLPDGRAYLNPGAFLDGGRYAVVTAGEVALKMFPD